MALFHHSPPAASRTLRVLALLLSYPDANMRNHLSAMRATLHEERALTPPRLAEIDALLASLSSAVPLEAEADYVQLFDHGRATSLHLFEHVHGDSRERGPAMVDLARTYEQCGLFLAQGELPDYLPVVLQFASTRPPAETRAFLGEMTHIFNALFAALEQRRSRYAGVLGALLELTGETPQPVHIASEPPLDERWEEPPAFAGCSHEGQAGPGQPQPIRIVRKDRDHESL